MLPGNDTAEQNMQMITMATATMPRLGDGQLPT